MSIKEKLEVLAHKWCVPQLRAEVKRLQSELKTREEAMIDDARVIAALTMLHCVPETLKEVRRNPKVEQLLDINPEIITAVYEKLKQ